MKPRISSAPVFAPQLLPTHDHTSGAFELQHPVLDMHMSTKLQHSVRDVQMHTEPHTEQAAPSGAAAAAQLPAHGYARESDTLGVQDNGRRAGGGYGRNSDTIGAQENGRRAGGGALNFVAARTPTPLELLTLAALSGQPVPVLKAHEDASPCKRSRISRDGPMPHGMPLATQCTRSMPLATTSGEQLHSNQVSDRTHVSADDSRTGAGTPCEKAARSARGDYEDRSSAENTAHTWHAERAEEQQLCRERALTYHHMEADSTARQRRTGHCNYQHSDATSLPALDTAHTRCDARDGTACGQLERLPSAHARCELSAWDGVGSCGLGAYVLDLSSSLSMREKRTASTNLEGTDLSEQPWALAAVRSSCVADKLEGLDGDRVPEVVKPCAQSRRAAAAVCEQRSTSHSVCLDEDALPLLGSAHSLEARDMLRSGIFSSGGSSADGRARAPMPHLDVPSNSSSCEDNQCDKVECGEDLTRSGAACRTTAEAWQMLRKSSVCGGVRAAGSDGYSFSLHARSEALSVSGLSSLSIYGASGGDGALCHSRPIDPRASDGTSRPSPFALLQPAAPAPPLQSDL